MRAKADEVYAQLRESQRRSVQHMGRITTEIPNASELIKDARDWVAGKSQRGALLALATRGRGHRLRAGNRKRPGDDGEVSLAGTVWRLDDGSFRPGGGAHQGGLHGRREGVRASAMGAGRPAGGPGSSVECADRHCSGYEPVELRALAQAGGHGRSCCRQTRSSLRGREELFARGFLAGFRWNLAESLSILVPQLENALRHVLVGAGHEVTTRDKHGLQNFIQMGTMLSERREGLNAILGTDIVQELRVLFVDQNGADLRNQIAHGLMRHEQFFHHASIYAWWFIFHLTICPVRGRFAQDGEPA